ncbi:hypothetical protein [Pseudonocardia oroxyli]|uniref:DUF4913 domain-containing protein n=1 Tax=Pseudonocardia oroxyli TaxID=366584 RepID=A0A1G7Z2S8_PSEOR|nr:hypothetical protein [Pseudonocardia oroxyli]SDH02796.1 hypothetical protein SAMN05216377_1189 [Pseudonocardia oroxyli]
MTDAIAGLAREVDGLRRVVQPLHGRVEDLAQLVARLSDSVARRSSSPAPSWLLAPADQTEVGTLLDDLVVWLGAVYLRYGDSTQGFPDCWCWHPDVVEELLWLMHAWSAAYQGDGASVALAGDWHERLRPGVVRRIHKYAGLCSGDNHRARPGWTQVDSAPPEVPNADAVAGIARWWGTDRDGEAPEPAPSKEPSAIRRTLNGRS